jgi:hypothetical protein
MAGCFVVGPIGCVAAIEGCFAAIGDREEATAPDDGGEYEGGRSTGAGGGFVAGFATGEGGGVDAGRGGGFMGGSGRGGGLAGGSGRGESGDVDSMAFFGALEGGVASGVVAGP